LRLQVESWKVHQLDEEGADAAAEVKRSRLYPLRLRIAGWRAFSKRTTGFEPATLSLGS
jgi:hypothetical protein